MAFWSRYITKLRSTNPKISTSHGGVELTSLIALPLSGHERSTAKKTKTEKRGFIMPSWYSVGELKIQQTIDLLTLTLTERLIVAWGYYTTNMLLHVIASCYCHVNTSFQEFPPIKNASHMQIIFCLATTSSSSNYFFFPWRAHQTNHNSQPNVNINDEAN